jgi:hypothetical protein
MEFNMLASKKQASIAIAATLVLSMPLAPAFSAPAPSNTALQTQVTPAFGRGYQVDCFWTDGSGQMNADSFPIDVLKKE